MTGQEVYPVPLDLGLLAGNDSSLTLTPVRVRTSEEEGVFPCCMYKLRPPDFSFARAPA